jgi:hypothetical protein
MGILKWVLVLFALAALGLIVLAKVIAFLNPPRPGHARPPALRRVERSLWWTVAWAVVVGVAILVLTVTGG